MMIFSIRFTKPILKLEEISKKMCKLDFNVKYDVKGHDEIAVLGQNMNNLSEILEKTISELKSANIKLETDIQKKTEIDEMRKDFLSNVSHELKTPIALIQDMSGGENTPVGVLLIIEIIIIDLTVMIMEKGKRKMIIIMRMFLRQKNKSC